MGRLCVRLGAPREPREPCPPPPTPPSPHQPRKAQIKPPGCPFHSSERGRDQPGSLSSPGQSEDGNPTLILGAFSPWSPWERVGSGSHWPPTHLSPPGTSGLSPAHEDLPGCRQRVGGFSGCSGAKHTPWPRQAHTGLHSCSSISQLCGLGQVSLPLCACFLICEMPSSLFPGTCPVFPAPLIE